MNNILSKYIRTTFITRFTTMNVFNTHYRSISNCNILYKERSTIPLYIEAIEFERKKIEAIEGQNILDICQANDIIEIEGACDGTLACSTCHIYLEPNIFTSPCEDEEDLLDMAPKVIEGRSRLGCQVRVTKQMKNTTITIPTEFSNQMY